MQAHPLSSPAARIPSTSPRTSPTALVPAHRAQPHNRVVQQSGKSSRNLSSKPAPLSEPPPPTLADTTGMAHDAGNLLGALGLYCDLLNAPGVLRPEHRHYATELRHISNRSSKLIRRLLAMPLATTPISSQPANPAHDHAAMLHGLTPVLQRIAAGVATVSVTCPASLPPLSFPSETIERIIINLVCNAAEAIRSNTHNKRSNTPAAASPRHGEISGKIHVTLAVLSNRLQLTVEDTGPGMPPAIAATFLQPTPLPRGATRGLGHHIIHELAAASEGQLSVRVRPGKGTVFCLKWPIPSPHPVTRSHSADLTTSSVNTAQEGSSTC